MDANDLLDSKFLQTINNFFHNNPHLKKLVWFEILESAWIWKPEIIFHKLQELAENGIEFSLDDFWTGEASVAKLLELMKRWIIKKLKIDGMLVKSLFVDNRIVRGNKNIEITVEILRWIFNAASIQGIKIICEYISEPELLHQIRDTFPEVMIYYQWFWAWWEASKIPLEVSPYFQNVQARNKK
jgi:EAL domain-containing protein (putative c-di-GMP-specific phosphodiesterase class I)